MSKQRDKTDEEAPHFAERPFTQTPATERARRDNNKDPDNAIGGIQDHLKRQRGDA